jgi:hypothetical protein
MRQAGCPRSRTLIQFPWPYKPVARLRKFPEEHGSKRGLDMLCMERSWIRDSLPPSSEQDTPRSGTAYGPTIQG